MTKSNLNAGGLTTRGWNVPARDKERMPRQPVPARSVRVPATRENRERLRELREAELVAWKVASPDTTLRSVTQRALTAHKSESWLFAGVAVIAAGGLMLGAAAALDFLTHWPQFVRLIRTALG